MTKIIWIGALMDPSGYGEASRNYVAALDETGKYAIKTKPKNFWNGSHFDLGDDLARLERLHRTPVEHNEKHITIQHMTPDNWAIQNGKCDYHIGITTFETDRIPHSWQTNMRSMDEIWTHSQWGKQIFENCGIRRPIYVIPHGVDVGLFRPGLEPLWEIDNRVSPDIFKFGSNFDWTERKNPRGLLKAYFSAFKASDQVALFLKTYYQYDVNGVDYIKAQIESVRTEMGLTESQTPFVYLVSGMMSSEQIARFYNSLDAYVLPSRGEGWSLTHSEAMSCGLPTIGVNWSGNTEFMNDSNSLLVNAFKMKEVSAADAGHQRQYIGHRWADPSVEELASHMSKLFNEEDRRNSLSVGARATMVKNYIWVDAAAKASARLDSI